MSVQGLRRSLPICSPASKREYSRLCSLMPNIVYLLLNGAFRGCISWRVLFIFQKNNVSSFSRLWFPCFGSFVLWTKCGKQAQSAQHWELLISKSTFKPNSVQVPIESDGSVSTFKSFKKNIYCHRRQLTESVWPNWCLSRNTRALVSWYKVVDLTEL